MSGALPWLWAVLVLLAVGQRGPRFHRASRRSKSESRRRDSDVVAELPEVIDLLVLAAGAGCNVRLALEAVAPRAPPIVGAALREVLDASGRGERLADALEASVTALGEPARPLLAALVASERYGGALVPALERLASEARADRRRRADLAARRLPVLMLFPLVLCILPAFGLSRVFWYVRRVPKAAAVYARISLDAEGRSLGVARQEKDCRRLAAAKGWPVAHVYVDNDLSASKPSVRRPEYEAMLEAVAGRLVDAVIVWDLDRLTRQPYELETFFRACDDASLNHLATVTGDIDLATGEGLLVARIKGAVAADEVRKLRQRVTRKKLELAERGLPAGGGPRAFGFERDGMTVRQVEADALRTIAGEVLAGGTLADGARYLNEQGFKPTGRASEFSPTQVRRMLRQPRVAGLRQHHGQILGDAAWPPILDRITWERVNRALAARNPTRVRATAHVLSGIATCGECGRWLTASARRNGGTWPDRPFVYQCRVQRGGCGRVAVHGPHLEALVDEHVTDWLTDPGSRASLDRYLAAGGDGNADQAVEQIARDSELLDELAGMLGTGTLTRGEWLAARDPIQQRLATARARLAATIRRPAATPITSTEILASYTSIENPAKRALLDLLIGELVIARAGRRNGKAFRPERVVMSPAW